MALRPRPFAFAVLAGIFGAGRSHAHSTRQDTYITHTHTYIYAQRRARTVADARTRMHLYPPTCARIHRPPEHVFDEIKHWEGGSASERTERESNDSVAFPGGGQSSTPSPKRGQHSAEGASRAYEFSGETVVLTERERLKESPLGGTSG